MPSLLSFEMVLDYPTYTKRRLRFKKYRKCYSARRNEMYLEVKTKSTDTVHLYSKDTISFSDKSDAVNLA